MDYYNTITSDYLNVINKPSSKVLIKIQPLDHWENALAEITGDIDRTDGSNTLNVSNTNGARRSLSITLSNISGSYTPDKNSHFWFNRKFKLLAGLTDGSNTYWQPQGVFICKTGAESGHKLTISAIDKGGNLNGECGIGRVVKAFSTDISAGDILIGDLVRETLLKGIGNGLPIDPIAPIIDPFFDKTRLYHDIALSVGQFYGDIIAELAQMYGADYYYNADGRLVFRRKPTYNIPSWYMHKGYIWRFKDNDSLILSGRSTSISLDGINCVTVMTDNTEGDIYSYTARNQNAESPINVKAVGERYPDEPIKYISIGDTSTETGEEKCKQYAEYLLLKQTKNSIAEDFTIPFLPHFDVDQLVFYKNTDYVIDELAVNLSERTMQVKACNVTFLPTNYTLSSY